MAETAERSYPKGQRRRSEIIEAAFARFASSGYVATSLAQIAVDCGISRMGLAHHFPTKESLLAAVLEERDRVNGERFFQGVDAQADGEDYFRRLIAVVDHNSTVPGLIRLYSQLAVEAADPAHPAHGFFVNRYVSIRRDIDAALAQLRDRGVVREGISIDAAGLELIALIDGLQVQWLMDPPAIDIGVRLRARLRELLVIEVS